MRRVLGLAAAVLTLAVAGCAQSADRLDDTLPSIAPVSTTTSTTTTTIAMIPITAGMTAVITPAPITAPPPPATPAPTVAPTAAPTAATPAPTAATAAPTTATTTAAPGGGTATTATTAPATTTTSLLAPSLTPLECTAAALDAADPSRVHAAPSCLAGWAIELPASCTADPCAEPVFAFQVTSDGWEDAGTALLACPTPLVQLGMPLVVASTFAGDDCDVAPEPGPTVIRPGDEGPAVVGVQAALVARGYDLATDGTFGPATLASVRHFQQNAGLEPDGLVGPQTQAVLFAPA